MASQISINVEYASQMYDTLLGEIEEIRSQLATLDKNVLSLFDQGEWKGDSADRFNSEYMEMQNKITQDFPQLLDDLNKNMKINLSNLVEADGTNAR